MSISFFTAPSDDNIRRCQEDNPFLQNFRDIGAMDTEYQELIRHIRDETSLKEIKKLPQSSTALKYVSMWNRLALLDDSADVLVTMDKY